jgi:hypothetical protein
LQEAAIQAFTTEKRPCAEAELKLLDVEIHELLHPKKKKKADDEDDYADLSDQERKKKLSEFLQKRPSWKTGFSLRGASGVPISLPKP